MLPAGNMNFEPSPPPGYNLEGLMTMKSAVLRVMTELSQPRDRMCPAERARIGHAWENNKQHKENCVTEMVACCIDLAGKYSLTEALLALKSVDPVSLRAALFDHRVFVYKMKNFWNAINLVAVERVQDNTYVNHSITQAITNCNATNSVMPRRFISASEARMSTAQLTSTLKELQRTTDLCVAMLYHFFTEVCEFRQYQSPFMDRNEAVATQLVSMVHGHRAKLANNYIL